MYTHEEKIHNTSAAAVILPELISRMEINSIIDIGCGIGTWLFVAKKLGVEDVLGVDGNYVDRDLLGKFLSAREFISHDLNQSLNLNRKFDLCFCLEVAEHLVENTADILIQTLVNHSDIILFSAAIPCQGGQNHLNEQRPEYWIEKFNEKGFMVYDPIRPKFWDNPNVEVWYKQNLFIFSRNKLEFQEPIIPFVVHPDLYQTQVLKKNQFECELKSIRSGKASPAFYLKRFFKSLLK